MTDEERKEAGRLAAKYAALTGFCAHGEGPNQNLYDMASKVADDVLSRMGGAK